MGLSRLALWAEIAGVSVVEPLLLSAYELESEREWREGQAAPHGEPWFSSFHSSQFPGADPYACGRAAVYGLMGLPDPEPISPPLRAMFNLGTNLEHDWVRRFALAGTLLSKSPAVGDSFQTNFVDREHWLTGASDAIVLPPFWRKSHCVEVKTTSHEKVIAMRQDRDMTPYSHAKYIRQLKTYISLANEAPFTPTVTLCKDSWAITREIVEGSPLRWCPVHEALGCESVQITLEPPDDGTLIYSSREEPLTTVSYYFSIDDEHMAIGREKLEHWRDDFIAGRIPAHPQEGERSLWSVHQCKYCALKKPCKMDYQAKVTDLAQSNHIEFAKTIRPTYDFGVMRAAVLRRWGVEE